MDRFVVDVSWKVNLEMGNYYGAKNLFLIKKLMMTNIKMNRLGI